MLVSWLVEWLLTGTLLEWFLICPCPNLGHLLWGTLDLGALQELIHQGRLLCKGARQLYDLSGQVLFAIRIRRAWMEYAFLSSGMVVNSGRDI
ncbi:hypothetical protein ACFX2G_003865 [Malus domestica]